MSDVHEVEVVVPDHRDSRVSDVSDGKNRSEWLKVVITGLTRLTGLGAIVFSLGSIAFYVAGIFAQRNYLGYFGVDSDGFPRSSDWLMVQGYFSTLERTFSALIDLNPNMLWVFLLFSTILICFLRWQPKPRRRQKKSLPNWVKVPDWVSMFFSSLMYSAWGLVISYFTFILSLVIVMFPALIGEAAGRSAAVSDAVKFSQGCSEDQPCTELLVGGDVMASGFVLAISLEHVAIYDSESGRVRVIPRAGVELSTPVPANSRETVRDEN